jgi:Mg2+/Co2+ transporter CorB
MEPLPLFIAILVLILLSGFFSATETAYSCANKIKLKTYVSQGKKNAKAVYRFADEDYDKLVTSILVGNNVVNLTASAMGTILFTKLMINHADLAPTVSTAVLTVVVLLFGEITRCAKSPSFVISKRPVVSLSSLPTVKSS